MPLRPIDGFFSRMFPVLLASRDREDLSGGKGKFVKCRRCSVRLSDREGWLEYGEIDR